MTYSLPRASISLTRSWVTSPLRAPEYAHSHGTQRLARCMGVLGFSQANAALRIVFASSGVNALPDEPRVPSARERNRIQPSEWLTFTVLLRTQRGDAGFNLGFPLAEAGLGLVSRCVGWQLELRFTSDTVEAPILLADIFGNALAGKPSTISCTI
jgi:hypothetical protein